jgi:16S rRNA (uracil1498-N3)-methyltransferase
MSLHRIWLEAFPDQVGAALVVAGEEAQHAIRVKRLEAGDTVHFLDGRGRIGIGRIDETRKTARHGWEMVCTLTQITLAEHPRVAVHVLSAVPKGDRLEQMVDSLVQAGAESWAPLLSERLVVEPREGKLARLVRVTQESSKQSGRPWVLNLGDGVEFDTAIKSAAADPSGLVILADGSGVPVAQLFASQPTLRAATSIRLLIGPEGGWSEGELSAARAAGVLIASFGPHVMRIETAAVVAAAVVVNIGM